MAILYSFANISYSLIQLDNSKHRSRAISRLSKGRKMHVLSCNIDYPSVPRSPESMFAFTTQHVVIEVPERTSDWSELKTFKTFSHKKRISIPMTRGRDSCTHVDIFKFCFFLNFEVKNLLAQQENLLALDNQMGLVWSPEMAAIFCMNPV